MRTPVPALALLALMLPAAAFAQTWDYKAYRKDPASGRYDKSRPFDASITLEEKDGKATFRLLTPGGSDPCYSRGALPAEVDRGEQSLVITVKPTLSGCEPYRFEIRNDGSGGRRMIMKDDRWVPDGFERGLTPKK